jgi:hypothetical protein
LKVCLSYVKEQSIHKELLQVTHGQVNLLCDYLATIGQLDQQLYGKIVCFLKFGYIAPQVFIALFVEPSGLRDQSDDLFMSNTKIYSWQKSCKPPVAPHMQLRPLMFDEQDHTNMQATIT